MAQKKQSPSEISITQPKLNIFFKISGFVEEIFLHKNTKFHVKAIMCSKVMKVLAKSLKNATEQACYNDCIDAELSFH